MRRSACAVVLAVFSALLGSGCHQAHTLLPLAGSPQPKYTITDLGAGMPSSINNRGQIAGEFAAGVFPNSKGFPYFHGCLWDNGKRTEMPTLGGWYSNAAIIADSSQIIGSATIAGHGASVEHGCLWQHSKITDLEADPRFRKTTLLHIAQGGTVYAISPPLGSRKQIHLWFYPNGFGPGIRQDKGIIGGLEVAPTAINDSGMVVGDRDTGKRYASSRMSVKQAFVWHVGQKKWTNIGTLGGPSSKATALNNSGQVVGNSDLPGDPEAPHHGAHAFLWERGKIRDLGALPGGYFSYPYAINDEGQIVGFSDAAQSNIDYHPILWEHGKLEDLSLLIPAGTSWLSLGGGSSINDHGQIVGTGSVEGDHWAHGYLLTSTGYNSRKGNNAHGNNESGSGP